MKLLRNLFDKNRHRFEGPNAPLARLYPLFEVMEGFFFVANKRCDGPPIVRDAIGIKRYMSMVILSLLPAYAMGVVLFGPRLLLMTAVSYAVGGVIEVLFALFRKEEVNEGFFVTGLIFPMILPPATPLWIVGLGVAFGVFFGKEVFGGTGHNIFNPALVGRCFVSLSWARHMAESCTKPFAWWDTLSNEGVLATFGFGGSVDALTGATPLGVINDAMREGGQLAFFSKETLNNYLGFTGGSVCETCAVLIVLSGVYLCWTRVANWRVPVSIIASYLVLGLIFSHKALWPDVFASPLVGIGAGGLLFGAFFMATDPVTSPATNLGKILYGTGIGVLVLLIRGMGAVPEGVTFAILIMNIFGPLFDRQIMRGSVPAALPREEAH